MACSTSTSSIAASWRRTSERALGNDAPRTAQGACPSSVPVLQFAWQGKGDLLGYAIELTYRSLTQLLEAGDHVEAVAVAEQMRKKKIASLTRQLGKLEKLQFN